MKAPRSSLPVLACCALALACGHAPPAAGPALAPPPPGAARPPGPTAASFHPLAVGNRWTWVDRSPSIPAGAPAPERTVRIVERTADGFFRDSERAELRADGDCLRDRARRLLCAPISAGNAWVSVTGAAATERFEIAAADERVEVPAGVFTGCVRVRAHQRGGAPGGEPVEQLLELTYAPGVGPVRLEAFVVRQGKASLQVRAELKSYSLAR